MAQDWDDALGLRSTDTVSTNAACRIAGMDSRRLNEVMVQGAFTCAPSTRRGVPRAWGEDDILALCMFRCLVGERWHLQVAGRAAQELRTLPAENPGLMYATMLFSGDGFVQWQAGQNWSPYVLYEAFKTNSIPLVTSFRVWSLWSYRVNICQGIKNEKSNPGEAA